MRIVVLVLLSLVFSIVLIEQKATAATNEQNAQAIALNKYCSSFTKSGSHSEEQLSAARRIMSKQHKAFFQCARDSDCVIVKGACSKLTSVARVAEQCFERAVYEYSAIISCLEIKGRQTAYPKCQNNMCTTRKK
jgi:hypothetical protein